MKKNKKNCSVDTAVIPIAGLGTRFLPLSKIIPKEMFPLGSKPIVQYVVEEAIEAGIKRIIFVISPKKLDIFKRYILNYFKEDEELVAILKERKKKEALSSLKCIPRVKYAYVIQRKPKGDGDAILKVKKLIERRKPFLVLFGDDISLPPHPQKSKEGVISKGMASEIIEVYKKVKAPVLCLYKMPKEKLKSYGVPKVKGIKDRIYQIEGLIEKPDPKEAPSNFALVGKYVLTYEVFDYLEKIEAQNGEIILANALRKMIEEGKKIYGIQTKNKWIECGTKEKWMENFEIFSKLD